MGRAIELELLNEAKNLVKKFSLRKVKRGKSEAICEKLIKTVSGH